MSVLKLCVSLLRVSVEIGPSLKVRVSEIGPSKSEGQFVQMWYFTVEIGEVRVSVEIGLFTWSVLFHLE